MRTLIPIHTFLPESRYGAELYTYYLARELQAAGVDVHLVFTERTTEGVTSRTFDGLPCTVVGQESARGPHRLDRPNPTAEAAFRTLLDEFRPDVVHIGHLLHLSTNLPRLARERGCRVVFTLHDYWLRCPKVKLLDWWGNRCTGASAWKCASCCRPRFSRMTWQSLKAAEPATSGRIALKEAVFQAWERPQAWRRLRRREQEIRAMIGHVDRFIAPVQFLADRMTEWGVPADKIVCCDYGTMSLPYAPRPPRPAGHRPRFGYLGGTTHEKGLHVLLGAFRGLEGADLVVYGGGHDWVRGEWADVFGQPNVRLGGFINDEQKADLLPQLDALVVPSVWYENSPVVIHEAFEAGVPVICSGIGGMAQLVTDGQDGLHFRPGDPADLRRVLERCVREPDLLPRLGRGVRRPESMRDHVRNKIIPLYESLCPARPVRASAVSV